MVQGKDDTESAHPHFHCLLLVSPSMHEGNNYISMKRWAHEWQQALQVNYVPAIDCKRLKGVGEGLRHQIISFTRYSMKPQEVAENRAWAQMAASETRGLRRFQSFGQIKTMLAKVEKRRSLNASQGAKDTSTRPTKSVWTWDAWSGKYRLN